VLRTLRGALGSTVTALAIDEIFLFGIATPGAEVVGFETDKPSYGSATPFG